jgi:aspartate 1-decarboxylase
MYRKMLKAKIHRAVVTHADLQYEGSITIDANLLDASGIREFELVQVVDVENGARLETYVMTGEPGSGVIQMNGAAARLVGVGDHVIIMAYVLVAEPLPEDWRPAIILVGENNKIKKILDGREDDPCAGC